MVDTSRGRQAATHIGKYEVLDPIGEGGMGQVNLARDPSGLLVVLKRPHVTGQASLADRNRQLIHEASVATLLSHPNIVAVYDADVDQNGVCYLAMEYLDGWDLEAVIRELGARRLYMPIPIVIELAIQACRGLYAAHGCRRSSGEPLNLIHRDITPSNLLLTTAGVLKILDFGIAKSSVQLRHTQGGMIKGKVPYMSPEQLRGETLDCRTDLFSLGAVLYELLTNTSPFDDVVFLERAKGHYSPQPPTRGKEEISSNLALVALRLLENDRELRYASALEVEKTLQEVRSNEPLPAPQDVVAFMTSLFELRRESSTRSGALVGSRVFVSGWSDTMLALPAAPENARSEVTDTEVSTPAAQPAHDEARPRRRQSVFGTAVAYLYRRRPGLRLPSFMGSPRFTLALVAVFGIGVLLVIGLVVAGNRISQQVRAVTTSASLAPASGEATSQPDLLPATVKALPSSDRLRSPDPQPIELPERSVAKESRARPIERRASRHPDLSTSRSTDTKHDTLGRLSLQVVPWADVYYEGKLLGGSPLVEQALPTGRVRLSLVNSERGIRREVFIDIPAGKLVRQTVYLDAP